MPRKTFKKKSSAKRKTIGRSVYKTKKVGEFQENQEKENEGEDDDY